MGLLRQATSCIFMRVSATLVFHINIFLGAHNFFLTTGIFACFFAPGNLNDLFIFDIPSNKWSDITGAVSGAKSVEKFSSRLIFQDGKLYTFGGANDAGIHHVSG